MSTQDAPEIRDAPDVTVESTDATPIAVFVTGTGPPLALVHGSIQDHSASAAFIAELAGNFTCYAMDRRGIGASGDGHHYSIEREFDDVAAVVDHIAAAHGGPVHVWGHSYGASCAMGGAARTSNVGRLVLYEPSLGLAYPPGVIDAVEQALSAGDNEAAIVTFLTELLDMTVADIDAMRASPDWPRRIATAPTVPRECRAEQDWRYRPGVFDNITAPTVLLSGSDSPDDLRHATTIAAAAIPHARVHVLEGHGHIAHRTHPAEIAALITELT